MDRQERSPLLYEWQSRVVFDCAAKFVETSLNDNLLQGPDLINNLVGVLLRFRQDCIALIADIKGMFHEVMLIVMP